MSAKKHRIKSFFSWMLAPFYVASGLALLLSCLSPYIDPASFALPAFFGLYLLPLLLLNLLLLLFGVLRRSRTAWFSFACILCVLPFSGRFINLRYNVVSDKKANALSIMTYNVGMYSTGKKGVPLFVNQRGTRQFLETITPDVVCFQEFFCHDTLNITRVLSQYPYHAWYFPRHNARGFYGNAIFSIYPLSNIGHILFEGGIKSAIFADVHYNSTDTASFRLCNVHLQSTNISLVDLGEKLYARELDQEEVASAHTHLRKAFLNRSAQVHALEDYITRDSLPVIICGDFNDTPMSYTYERFAKAGLNDAFMKGGRNFGGTFRFLWPLLRIDYIFADPVFKTISQSIVKCPWSDHYPVLTHYEFYPSQDQ